MPFGLGPDGFTRKKYADIVADMEARARNLFGENVNLSERSPLGIFIKIIAWSIALLWELAEAVYYSAFIDTSEGTSLDYACKYAGIARKPAKKASVTPSGDPAYVKFTGDAGTTVAQGKRVATEDGVEFETLEEVTLDAAGEAYPKVQAVEAGEQGNVPANTITVIINPQAGLSSVTNPEEITGGQDEETDAELRQRYYDSLAKGGSSTVESIKAALLEVDGVKDVVINENDTINTVDGIPPKSFEVLVYGGTDNDVAQAIFNSKSAGIQSYGSTTVDITDSMGKVHTIGFTRPIFKDIYVDVTLTTNENFPVDGKTQVQTEIIKYIGGTDANAEAHDGLGLGEDVIHYKVIAACSNVPGITDLTVQIGFAADALGTANLAIASNEVAQTNTTKVTVTVA